jgi:restriction endonuclease S subunit
MIRVRIKNEAIRFYVYAYLQSFAGHNQMLKNEYGSVQQHLEAKHISGILIPIPPTWDDPAIAKIISPTRAAVKAREKLEESLLAIKSEAQAVITQLINGKKMDGEGV